MVIFVTLKERGGNNEFNNRYIRGICNISRYRN